jgi:hypothetical protein
MPWARYFLRHPKNNCKKGHARNYFHGNLEPDQRVNYFLEIRRWIFSHLGAGLGWSGFGLGKSPGESFLVVVVWVAWV